MSVVDLVGMLTPSEPTLDLGVLTSLQRKRDAADEVMGDEVREWLCPRAVARNIDDSPGASGAAG